MIILEGYKIIKKIASGGMGDVLNNNLKKGKLYYKSSGKIEFGEYNKRGEWKKR
jgi:hypothetical protein